MCCRLRLLLTGEIKMEFKSKIKTIEWVDNYSKMVDQTVIPYEYKFVNITSGDEMFAAIRNMIVRGAPAIGIAGAHGVILFAQELEKQGLTRDEFVKKLIEKAEYMKTSRPTAVNLMWACEKQIEVIKNSKSDISGIIEELKANGIKLEDEDIEINKKIGDYGAEVVPKGATILTHCNAGALATVGGNCRLRNRSRGSAFGLCKRQHDSGFCRRNPSAAAGGKNNHF